MEPRQHPDRRFLWWQRRMAYRRIEVGAIDAALRVLESNDDDWRTRITALWRRFVLAVAAEAADAAAERATRRRELVVRLSRDQVHAAAQKHAVLRPTNRNSQDWTLQTRVVVGVVGGRAGCEQQVDVSFQS